jgi:hypothetical protein
MSQTMIDMWLLILQLMAACGGLILIGYLSVTIAKNRRSAKQPLPRSDTSFSDTLLTQLVDQQFQKALAQNLVPTQKGIQPAGSTLCFVGDRDKKTRQQATLRVKKGAALSSKTNSSPLEIRLRQAAHLAAQGVEPGIIQRRVELPRCEIDLIAKLNNQYAQFHWGRHRPLLEAIESAG